MEFRMPYKLLNEDKDGNLVFKFKNVPNSKLELVNPQQRPLPEDN